jgi:hypothetical protein
LEFYRKSAAAAAAAAHAPKEVDLTSRKATGRGGGSADAFFLLNGAASSAAAAAAAPSGPRLPLCSLLDMCADHCAFFLDKIPGSFLDATPPSVALRILAKASEAQLNKFENANAVR